MGEADRRGDLRAGRGAFGGGGPVIVDRKQMYGDDPANDPYSPEYDPAAKRDLRR